MNKRPLRNRYDAAELRALSPKRTKVNFPDYRGDQTALQNTPATMQVFSFFTEIVDDLHAKSSVFSGGGAFISILDEEACLYAGLSVVPVEAAQNDDESQLLELGGLAPDFGISCRESRVWGMRRFAQPDKTQVPYVEDVGTNK